MAGISKHIIKQQLLDITIADRNDQEEITNTLSEIYKSQIEEIFEEVCTDLIPPNEVLRLNSLTLDIGHLEFEKLATDFPKAVKKAVREVLFKQMRDQKVSTVRVRKAAGQNKEMALVYYLETGLLPWYYEGNFENLRQEFSDKKIIGTEALLRTFNYPISRKRVVHFFEERALVAFLSDTLSKEERRVLGQLKTLRSCLGKLGPLQKATKDNVISATIKSLLAALSVKEEAYSFIMQQFILQLGGESKKVIKSLSQLLPGQIIQKLHMVLHVIAWKKEEIFTMKEMDLLHALETTFKAIPHKDIHLETRKNEFELDAKFKIDKSFEIEERLDVEQGGIGIHNAGLILIWPYLEAFFTGLGLMRERSFIAPDSATKAIHLLHYLVFKTEEGDETEWLLNKILCGIEPTEFIPEHFDLSPTEKEECTNLLNALIGNWPALKNAGPDSLRQTFLQRDGLLVPDENGWTLKVERKAFDVLLDRLTWAISVVKMPWNDYLINTEW